jgi:hypothetical protein
MHECESSWEANRLIAKGKIHPTLSKTYRLEEAGEAVLDVHRAACRSSGGHMLALKEDSHRVEIDPLTLVTIGAWDSDGALTSARPRPTPRSMHRQEARSSSATQLEARPPPTSPTTRRTPTATSSSNAGCKRRTPAWCTTSR